MTNSITTTHADLRLVFSTLKFYPNRYWFFYFKKRKFVKGFDLRVFGLNIKIQEWDATVKTIAAVIKLQS